LTIDLSFETNAKVVEKFKANILIKVLPSSSLDAKVIRQFYQTKCNAAILTPDSVERVANFRNFIADSQTLI